HNSRTKRTFMTIQEGILPEIPDTMTAKQEYDKTVSHAPNRKDVLSAPEKRLAVENALRYFPQEWHQHLAKEFLDELQAYGRIYMYRFRPTYARYARPREEYPARCRYA